MSNFVLKKLSYVMNFFKLPKHDTGELALSFCMQSYHSLTVPGHRETPLLSMELK